MINIDKKKTVLSKHSIEVVHGHLPARSQPALINNPSWELPQLDQLTMYLPPTTRQIWPVIGEHVFKFSLNLSYIDEENFELTN